MYSKDVNKAKAHVASDYENARESVKFLHEAIKLQQKKSRDYQNPNSTVTQADYYPRGLYTIMDTIHAKLLRAQSILETYEDAQRDQCDYSPNFESLEDTFMDIVNYASFAGSWCRGKMEGQDPRTGLLSNKSNRKVSNIAEDLMKSPAEDVTKIKVWRDGNPTEVNINGGINLHIDDEGFETVSYSQ